MKNKIKLVEIGKDIYFIKDNKVFKTKVMGVYFCKYNSWYLYGREENYPEDASRIDISKAFPSKEELLNNL